MLRRSAVPIAIVMACALFVIIFTFALVSGMDERNARFKQECVEQGGKVVAFENHRTACLINGEKFYR